MPRLVSRIHGSPAIVALGGGTGLSTMLRGLRAYTDDLTAIVSVGDNGGSSGRLRHEFGVIPPGDIRNCLVALSDAGPTLERLFQHRFASGSPLDGHAFGNLFLAALAQVTGDAREAVREATRILNVRGTVIPVSNEPVHLVATHPDGSKSTGEAQITAAGKRIAKLDLRPQPPPIASDIRDAIARADLLVLAPGSLYTSIMPTLLVPGMTDALTEARVPVAYVCNLMTQPGETDGYDVAAHVHAIERHTVEGLIDIVIANNAAIDEAVLASYREAHQDPVTLNGDWPFRASVRKVDLARATTVLRHDPDKLAKVILSLAAPQPRSQRRRAASGRHIRRSSAAES